MATVTQPMALDSTLQSTNTALGLLGKDATLQSIVTALATIGLNTVGNLASLTTEQKTSLVAAINEINAGKISTSAKGSANGVAELDSNGLVPANQLPSYVDDVLNGTAQNVTQTGAGTYSATAFILEGESTPCTPETGKTYVDITSEIQYRWTGLVFVSMGSNLALGETSTTAYRGDRGKAAYDHSQDANRVTSATATGLYKIGATAQGHIAELVAVLKSDLTALGLIGEVADSTTNGNIVVDGTEIQVYDDAQVQSDIQDIEDVITTDTTSASGNPLSIVGLKSTQNAINPIVTLEPIQDLHGQDKPYPAGGGKNKWNVTSQTASDYHGITAVLNSDGTISLSGTNDGSLTSIVISSCYLENGVEYLLNGGYNENIFIRDITASVNQYGSIRVSLTGDGTNHQFQIRVLPNTVITGTVKIYPMIRLATETDSSFAPYSNICPISGYDKIEVLSCGKNLYGDGNISGTLYVTQNLTKELSAGTYTLSAIVVSSDTDANVCLVYDATNNVSLGTIARSNARTSLTFTLSATCSALTFYASKSYPTSVDDAFSFTDIQIESGNQATSYEPYHKTTDLSENLPQTVYGGSLDLNSGVLTVDRQIIDMGDFTWTRGNNSGSWTNYFLYTQISDMHNSNTNDDDIVCSIYAKQIGGTTSTANDKSIITRNNNYIYVRDDSYTDADVFKTAVTGQKLVYELATPIEIQLTPTELTLLKDYAYVSTNGTRIDLGYRNGEMATLGDVLDAQNKLQEEIDNPISYDGKNYRLGMDATGLYLYNITDDTKAYIQMVTP